MAVFEFALLVVAALSAIPAAWAYAMIQRDNPRFTAARMLCWASALGFGSLGVIWGVASSEYPMWIRVGAGAIIAAIAGGALTWVLSDINTQASPPGSVPAQSSSSAAATGAADPCAGKRKVTAQFNTMVGGSVTDLTGKNGCGGDISNNVVIPRPGGAMLESNGGAIDKNNIQDNYIYGGGVYKGVGGEFKGNTVTKNHVVLPK